jgi:hypothetical protein
MRFNSLQDEVQRQGLLAHLKRPILVLKLRSLVCGRSQLQEHQLRQCGAPVVIHEYRFGGQGNVGDL